MNVREQWKPLVLIVGTFLLLFYLPLGNESFDRSISEALGLAKWYAREHVLLCLVPAFFIAGAISVFVSQGAVMKYLGAQAGKVVSYGVASVSGAVLAVCSCTILPLFAGIYKRGAGIGPAATFLYAGPAINVLAVILTARILGVELGAARAVGAIVFGVVVGLVMSLVFRNDEREKAIAEAAPSEPEEGRRLRQNVLYFAAMVAILVFATWGRPASQVGAWHAIYSVKWILVGGSSLGLAAMLVAWFHVKWWHVVIAALPAAVLTVFFPSHPSVPFAAGILGLAAVAQITGGEPREWLDSTWGYAKQILPLLFAGVLAAGFLMGSPEGHGLVPSDWVRTVVGGNSLRANAFASVAGALMYFATLTEVPILQGLIASGMGKGPALALLLAGPALSLPNMLVIRSVMGTRKTLVYIALVVVMATASGLLFGAISNRVVT
ncbi:MAG: permease [Latescibacteria bacterium DG_63]|nr:MAG: permease [Latescibacteria bacterium DG_63]